MMIQLKINVESLDCKTNSGKKIMSWENDEKNHYGTLFEELVHDEWKDSFRNTVSVNVFYTVNQLEFFNH